jgi:hypothetical protein
VVPKQWKAGIKDGYLLVLNGYLFRHIDRSDLFNEPQPFPVWFKPVKPWTIQRSKSFQLIQRAIFFKDMSEAIEGVDR